MYPPQQRKSFSAKISYDTTTYLNKLKVVTFCKSSQINCNLLEPQKINFKIGLIISKLTCPLKKLFQTCNTCIRQAQFSSRTMVVCIQLLTCRCTHSPRTEGVRGLFCKNNLAKISYSSSYCCII